MPNSSNGYGNSNGGSPQFGDYAEHGLSRSASIAVNTVWTVSGVVIDHHNPAVNFGKTFGPGFTVAVGFVDVTDAALHGTAGDVVVQTLGIGGSLGGAWLGSEIFGGIGTALGGPLVGAAGVVAGGVGGHT